jgi:uncharacterized protein (DUF486 family)
LPTISCPRSGLERARPLAPPSDFKDDESSLLKDKPWYLAVLVSWGIAFFEYVVQVPANRIGHTELNLAQLKILQEVITLSVFVPFALYYMNQPVKLDYLWAALCMCGAVYFIFRN